MKHKALRILGASLCLLAYSAGALLSTPRFVDDSYLFYASIGSQNDKLRQAVDAYLAR